MTKGTCESYAQPFPNCWMALELTLLAQEDSLKGPTGMFAYGNVC